MTSAPRKASSSPPASALPPEPGTALSDVEREVAVLFRRADASRTLAGHLDRSAYQILLALGSRGPLNINTLAQALNLDASTVTRQVVAIERSGLVERRRDDEDRRSVVVQTTPLGHEELRVHREARAATYAQVLAGWDEDDRRRLAAMLQRLNASLDDYRRGLDARD